MTKIVLSVPIYICRFMKWTLIITTFIITALLSARAADSFGQTALETRVSVRLHNTPLRTALKTLSQQAQVDFAYNTRALPLNEKVSLVATDQPLSEVLGQLTAPLGLTYRVIGQSILIEKAARKDEPPKARLPAPELPGPVVVTGRVTDTTGWPLPGATVSVTGTAIATRTDGNGAFTLSADAGLQVLVTYLGYRPYTFTITVQQPFQNIILHQQSGSLREVVVSTGYQELPKERATGSFVQVDRALIERSVSTNVIDRLRDVVPGLHFDPGSETLRIHGQTTLFSNADPLIVVDGFPYNSPIGDLNPNDVESISVLKDAAAASIWGTKAGNGVVVITTRKGAYGHPAQVTFNASINIGAKPDLFYIPSMSSADYIATEKQLFGQGYYTATEASTLGLPLSPVVELLIAQRDGKATAAAVNSQLAAFAQNDVRRGLYKYLYRPSVNQQYAASVAGGTANERYFFSAGFDKNLDNLAGNSLDRVTLKATNTWAFFHKKLEFTAGVNLTQNNRATDNPGTINWNRGQFLYPYAQLADAQGNPLAITHDYRQNFIAAAQQKGLLDWSYRPLQELQLANNQAKANDYRVNSGLRYKLPLGFTAELLYQYDFTGGASRNLLDPDSYTVRNLVNHYTQLPSGGVLSRPIPTGAIVDMDNSHSENHDLRAQLDYQHTFARKHELTAIAGYEIQSLHVLDDSYRLYGFDREHAASLPVDGTDVFTYYDNPNSGNLIPQNQGEGDAIDHSISWYGNAAYTYDGRLTVSGSARLDQSNLFGVKANQKGVPLWSAGASWNLSREGFYQLDAVPELKLRATYGYNGNINKSLSAYTTALYWDASNQGSQLPYASISNPPNPNLRWERDQNINLGADFSLKGGRISGSFDYFWKKGIDLIGSTSYAPSSGIIVFTGNDAGTRGHGFDLSLQTRNLVGRLKWVTDFFISYVADVVTEYNQQSTTTAYLSSGSYGQYALLGKPLFAIYSLRWAGLDPANGDPQGYLNGVVSKNWTTILGTATPASLVYNGPSRPPVFGSFRNTLSYGNFSLSANISYELGFYFRKRSERYGNDNGLSSQSGDYQNRWQKPGDEAHTNVPSIPVAPSSARDDFYTYSSALVFKGDNVRLRDARLSYRLKGAELYIYGANLGILWKANKVGQDPDAANTYPAPRTIAGGIRFTY